MAEWGEPLDVGRILAFAEGVRCDAGRVWEHAIGDQRRRLQRILSGGRNVRFGRRRQVRTGATCLAFGLSTQPEAETRRE